MIASLPIVEGTAAETAGGIPWCDRTWNCIRGCKKYSAGCKHCYAEAFAERFRGVPGHVYELGFDPRLVPERLVLPLRWIGSQRIFVDSMSDPLLGPGEHKALPGGVPFEYLAAMHGIMAAAPRHTFQLLTKRAERLPLFAAWMREQAERAHAEGHRLGDRRTDVSTAAALTWAPNLKPRELRRIAQASATVPWPLPNLHVIVTVEDNDARARIDQLMAYPAAVRGVSYEPALEYVDFARWLPRRLPRIGGQAEHLGAIDWIIIGGESGRRARPFDLAWARELVRLCAAAGVACFVKQLGRAPYSSDASDLQWFKDAGKLDRRSRIRLASSKGADAWEWPADLRVRQFPTALARAA